MTQPDKSQEQNSTVQIPFTPALYGLPYAISISQTHEDSNNPKNKVFLPGEYKVTFILSKPGKQIVEMGSTQAGNSYFQYFPPSPDQISAQNTIEFHAKNEGDVIKIREFFNAEKFLTAIQVESINAQNHLHADFIARQLILPSMSHYSTTLNVPFYICQTEIKEIRTDARFYKLVSPIIPIASSGSSETLSNGLRVMNLNKEIYPFIAIYREALNSNSFLYQFLCFYKIIGGIYFRRSMLKKGAIDRGETIRETSERVPKDQNEQMELLRKIFPIPHDWNQVIFEAIFPLEFQGKKIRDVMDNDFRPVRNEIGYAFLDETNMSLSIDISFHNEKVSRLLPLIRVIARYLLFIDFPDQFPTS